MSTFVSMMIAALYACLLQNVIFTGGFGSTEAIRISSRPRFVLLSALFITYFSSLTSLSCRLLETVPRVGESNIMWKLMLYLAVLFVIYIITALILIYIFKADEIIIRRLGVSAFNTLVISIPVLNQRAAYTLSESIASGVGAGLAFFIAVMIIHAGIRMLDKNPGIPTPFKGTPAIFLYVSLIALAFAGWTGSAILV